MCSEMDWLKFYEPMKGSKFNELKEKKQMFCMNEVDLDGKLLNLNLFGNNVNEPNRHIEIIYRPCKPRGMNFANETSCTMEDPKN